MPDILKLNNGMFILEDGIIQRRDYIVPAGYGADLLTDGGLESWMTPNDLMAGWSTGDITIAGGTFQQNNTEQYAGTWCGEMITGVNGESKFLRQKKTGLTADAVYRIAYRGKTAVGQVVSFSTALFDDDPVTATEVYNFNTQTWDAWVGGSDLSLLGVQHKYTANLRDFYIEAFTEVTAPASGSISMSFYIDGVPDSKTVYFDSATLTKFTDEHTELAAPPQAYSGEAMLNDFPDIDATVTQDIALFTTADDELAIITKAVYACLEAESVFGGAGISIGTNEGQYDNIFSFGTLPSESLKYITKQVSDSSAIAMIPPSTTVYAKITGSAGVAYLATVLLIGVLKKIT